MHFISHYARFDYAIALCSLAATVLSLWIATDAILPH